MPAIIAAMLPDRSDFRELTADAEVGGLIVTNHVHHEIHEGEMFTTSYVVPHGSEIANDATQEFLFVTAASKVAHLSFIVAIGGDSEMELYEGTATSANGTGLAELNMNRTSSNTATVTTFHTPTVDTDGTLLQHLFLPGGSGPTSAGNLAKQDTEWILATSTKYLFRVTNRSGNAIQLSVMFEWYEEDV